MAKNIFLEKSSRKKKRFWKTVPGKYFFITARSLRIYCFSEETYLRCSSGIAVPCRSPRLCAGPAFKKNIFVKEIAKFFEVFANSFEVFVSFSRFSDVFGLIRIHSNLLGRIRTHSEASGSFRKNSDWFLKF